MRRQKLFDNNRATTRRLVICQFDKNVHAISPVITSLFIENMKFVNVFNGCSARRCPEFLF
jgi:hypothetical protein